MSRGQVVNHPAMESTELEVKAAELMVSVFRAVTSNPACINRLIAAVDQATREPATIPEPEGPPRGQVLAFR